MTSADREAIVRWGKVPGFREWPCVIVPHNAPGVPKQLVNKKKKTIVRFSDSSFYGFNPDVLLPYRENYDKFAHEPSLQKAVEQMDKWISGEDVSYLFDKSLPVITSVPTMTTEATGGSDSDDDRATAAMQKRMKKEKQKQKQEQKQKRPVVVKTEDDLQSAKRRRRVLMSDEEHSDAAAAADNVEVETSETSAGAPPAVVTPAASAREQKPPTKKRLTKRLADSDDDETSDKSPPKREKASKKTKIKPERSMYTSTRPVKGEHAMAMTARKEDLFDVESANRELQDFLKEEREKNGAVDPADVKETIALLQKLQRPSCNITVEVLRITKIGHTVNQLRKSRTPMIATLATKLTNSWKELAKQETKKALLVLVEVRVQEDGEVAVVLQPQQPQQSQQPTQQSQSAHSTMQLDSVDPRDAAKRHSTITRLAEKLQAGDTAGINVEALAATVEKAIYDVFDSASPQYMHRARSIIFNLDKNQELRADVLKGEVKPEQLARMTPEEMASKDLKAQREKIAAYKAYHSTVAKQEASTDQFRCGKCGQRKTTFYQLQTRSADEPMTTFVTCVNCGNRWKFC